MGEGLGADGGALVAPAGEIDGGLFAAGKPSQRVTDQGSELEGLAGASGEQAQLRGEPVQHEVHVAGHGVRADHGLHPFLNPLQFVEQEGVEQFHQACWWLGDHRVGFGDAQLPWGPVDAGLDPGASVTAVWLSTGKP